MPDYAHITSVVGYRDLDQDPQQDILECAYYNPTADEFGVVLVSADAGTLEAADIETAAGLEGVSFSEP
jgi:hypothetical protein